MRISVKIANRRRLVCADARPGRRAIDVGVVFLCRNRGFHCQRALKKDYNTDSSIMPDMIKRQDKTRYNGGSQARPSKEHHGTAIRRPI
jgi:hypothetical protein